MLNRKIAEQLDEMSRLLEMEGDNPFRIRAFRRAAQIIESHSEDFENLNRDQILEIEGVGKGIADFVDQMKSKGVGVELEKLRAKYPKELLTILNMPGMGPKRASVLFKTLKIDNLEKLAEAAKTDKIAGLPGFGEKIQDTILKNLSMAQESTKRILISEALLTAAELTDHLKSSPVITRLQTAGSVRRWKETIGDVDVLCTSLNPEKAIHHFTNYPDVQTILSSGQTKASVRLKSGLQCDFRVVEDASFGAALLYFTGSKEHNVKLRELALKKNLTLNEYGLFKLSDHKKTKPVAGRTEEAIYDRLGLQWIPPELREDRGEIDAAMEKKIPKLVTEEDVLGDVHNHTSLTDGSNTIEEMAEGARQKKWRWYFCGDHSPLVRVSSGLSQGELMKKKSEILRLAKKIHPFQLALSSEVDIRRDGTLDYPDSVLSQIDCVVASVHFRFKQSEDQMTERICSAIKNPFVHILGHITGRLIFKREAYAVDTEKILATAKNTQTAIEINGQPERQ
ncbi:MAG: DNA polymerase/3'-5' exonuclease PolX, partial [Elusimicrobia bacterium]|nr:DNA polymerase/3'-5' exonuclease PolX [Candidatus Obscuribacterium magneticum]